MKLVLTKIHQKLNKAYLKQDLTREQIENQIDQLVYVLYGLTEEEIGIVEGSAK